MKQTYVVTYNIPLLGIRIALIIFALSLAAVCISHGAYFLLLAPLIVILYTIAYSAVDIDFNTKEYYEYTWVLGFKLGHKRGTLSNIKYILIRNASFTHTNYKKTAYISTAMPDRNFTTHCYEVSLVSDKKQKLVLLYAYDKKVAQNAVLKIEQNLDLPVKDNTGEIR